MTVFYALALALLALALWPLLSVLWRSRSGAVPTMPQQANLALLREQRAQLDAEFSEGKLTPAELEQARAELARRVLDESAPLDQRVRATHRNVTATGLLLAVPALAIGLYVWLGEPDAVRFEAELARQEGASDGDVDTMVRQMAQQLQSRPPGQAADAPAWAMLARAHASRQRFADADQAYQRALELTPDNPDLLADRADLLSLLQGQSASGEPMRLVNRALEVDPGHPKALALAGSAAYGRQDFVAAQALWQRARARAAPGSPFDQGLQSSLEAARASIASQPGGAARLAAAPADPAPAATNHPGVRGQITIAPELQGQLAAGDTLFVFARPVQGPRMPLAVLRVAATSGPVPFALDDSLAMAPELRLSMHEQVVVEARISRTGQALPQSGDLQGTSGPVASNSAQLQIRIDSVVP
ncbi:MAG: c-type cytochrome biogenesis protein CcmI [Hydrogenophaga sp.]|uniref:c-type cytochrome biogenesis protein CcmI n=1 Tax=Hydrogenophaga sp. TaxID=1904254 RepID=UPI00271AAD57|nr:c-type cytochrome biogenesis protein CcmI [Hydrogenophaga sp.]MDO9506684.1 c-type cytochrome biogenesis protein CcmI [Hydrogenophaga sp.]MDP3628202.1 c-type cytochrome biogenesis protein CcmI [Hydrogenophaga sp.]